MATASDRESPLLRAALAYARKGVPVFPLTARGKEPVIPKREGGRGLHDATVDEEAIRAWWRRWPDANIGAPTGEISGWVVVDIDPDSGGDQCFDVFCEQYGELPDTLTAVTGGGGYHKIFAHPGGVIGNRTKLGGVVGIDVRGDGGYIVVAPSIHPSGVRYEWVKSGAPIAAAPEWLVELIRRPRPTPSVMDDEPWATRRIDAESDGQYWLGKALERASEGTRNDTGFWLACQLRDAGLFHDEADHVMREYAERAPGSGYSEREALASLKQAYGAPRREPARSLSARTAKITPLRRRDVPESPENGPDSSEDDETVPQTARNVPQSGENVPPATPEHRTDLGNARRFVKRHGRNVRHVAAWGAWLVWDGMRWRRDETGDVMRKAKETVSSIYGEASDCDDEHERKEIAKWAVKSEAEARLRAMLALAESEPEIAIAPDRLDANQWLLTVRNGTLDLRTGQLLEHDRTHLITRLVDVAFDPQATCPKWLAFLERIMAGDQDVIAFVQRAVGYSLTGDTSEQVMFLLHGKGANGKSKLLGAIEGILGDYGMQTPTTTLMAKRDNGIPNDVARLKGTRFVKAIETEEGHSLAESLVKQMTGGDMLSARFMRGEWFDFRPSFKLWLAANHLPTVRGNDDGIWRRIRYIPFEVQIPESEWDKQLDKKLSREYSGILAWAVRGCLDWQKGGLRPPAKVLSATNEYRLDMDSLRQFFETMCERHPTGTTAGKALKASYEQWCEEIGEARPNLKRLAKYLREQGFQRTHTRSGWLWVGFKLTPCDPVTDGDSIFHIATNEFASREAIGDMGSQQVTGSQEPQMELEI